MKTITKNLLRNNPLPVELQEKILFWGKCGYWPDFDAPRSFNEKINWRKLHSTNPLYVTCCDKLAVRELVRERIGGEHLVPVLFEGKSITAEQILELGDDIVVKTNHDSGSVFVIRENTPARAAEVAGEIRRRLRRDYGRATREWYYSHVKPQVFVERFLEGAEGSVPFDVKLYVFRSGDEAEPRLFVEVDHERGSPEHNRTFYDEKGEVLFMDEEAVTLDYEPNLRVPFPCPDYLPEMRRIALRLSEGFDHVRVDLYCIDGHVWFGELTLSDGGGRSRWSPRSFDFHMGEQWNLDRRPGGSELPGPRPQRVRQAYVRQNRLRRWKYEATRRLRRLGDGLAVAAGRVARFFALPYAVVAMVDWSECRRHPVLVCLDHLYIFFVLKYFPDNYASCRLYEKPRSEWKYYYGRGYDPLAIARRNRHVRRPECAVLFEDKEICHAMCRSFLLPQPHQYGAVSPGENLAGRLEPLFARQDARRIFIKPNDGDGGRGACVAEREDGRIVIRQVTDPGVAIPVEQFELAKRCVLEEAVRQHPELSSFYPHGLNTLRIATLLTPEDEILVVGAILRLGSGGNFVDNGGQGGIAVRVDHESGRLADAAVDYVGHPLEAHPDTGKRFAGRTLPSWAETVDLAREVQRHFAPFNRFIGMDLGISEDGPVVIELNDIFGGGTFEAVAGPMLRDPEVRRCLVAYEMITHRKFG
ncbi:MAG: sugar-transfer associated ATP-grasp domain-containing protein [Verrucomicrobiales bacterium]